MQNQFLLGTTRKSCLVAFALSVVSGFSSSAGQVEFPQTIPSCPAEYLTDSLLASDGSIWVTSEGKGIFRYYPGKDNKSDTAWLDASYFRGLPDTVNYYALAEDKQGRIWAGTDNKGVAVFNGETWQTYDRENALLGERVFDIAVSQKTGDVAVATSGGISIFQPSKGDWVSLTRAGGLVEDQVKALAYDLAGDLWIAYSCGGVSQLSGKDSYKVLQTVQSKWYWDEKSGARQPLTATGEGLPSNLCDAILPLRNGGIVVGTTSGLGWMPNRKNGKWKFVRGKDYDAKNKGLMNPPALVGNQVREELLLPEDYITCLSQGKQGIWVGFREKGAVLLDPMTMTKKAEAKFPKKVTMPWVTSMLMMPNESVYATTYGFGFVKIGEGDKNKSVKLNVVAPAQMPVHPQVAKVMSEEEIEKELEKRDAQFKVKEEDSPVVFWKEDWATQGDWCERYGTHKGLLCATAQPENDEIWNGDVEIDVRGEIGSHRLLEGDLYSKFFQGDITDDVNVLHDPKTGTRVAAQWVDRKEGEYKSYHDGPDIWTVVDVPEGRYEIALYFYNYGEKDGNRQGEKDYLVEVRQSNQELSENTEWKDEIKEVVKSPVLARTRVSDFKGGGVYKSFFADKGGRYYFRVVNNYSPITICNAVLVSRLGAGVKIPEGSKNADVFSYGRIPPHPEEISDDEKNKFAGVLELWRKSSLVVASGKYLSGNRKLQDHLYKLVQEKPDSQRVILNWRWYLRYWNSAEHDNFKDFMCKCWYSVQDLFPTMRSEEFFPYSPRTVSFSPRELKIMRYMGLDWKDYLEDSNNKPRINAIDFKAKAADIDDKQYQEMELNFMLKQ